MEYKKTVETFDLDVDKSYLTKNLPTKWTCHLTKETKICPLELEKKAFKIKCTYYGFASEINSTGSFTFIQLFLRSNAGEPMILTHTTGAEDNLITCTNNEDLRLLRITISTFVRSQSVTAMTVPLVGVDVRDVSSAHDHTLIVGAEKIYVKKALLSFYSSFFDRMFNGSFEEAKKDETTLEEVDATEFGTLIQMLYPGTHAITENNVIFLWKLADRFDIPSIASMCETFICNLNDNEKNIIKLYERIELANQYNSAKLMAAVTKLMKAKKQ